LQNAKGTYKKQLLFLYSSKHAEKERKIVQFISASKNNQGRSINKKIKDLYNQNYKTMKNLKIAIENGKISHVHRCT
jgi:hypothetical protein